MKIFKKLYTISVTACGGDGTVGWILSVMDKMEFGTDSRGRDRRPAIAIIPLGTGNDLSRSLEWGGKYREKPLRKVVMDIAKVNGAAYLAINSWKPRTILPPSLLCC